MPADAVVEEKPLRVRGTTAECVRRARAGDAAAFERLVVEHERMVLRTALRLLGRLDLAEDAAQETFMRVHRFLGKFDETRPLAPWLYRMVTNACRDIGRRAFSTRLVPIDEATAPVSLPALDDALLADERRRLVEEALAMLPEKERAALVLRDIEGLSTTEVADILGSSEGTVRSRVCTARIKIRRFVEARSEGRS